MKPSLLLAVDLGSILGSVWSYVLIILGFSLVVFVHELGHFLAAKWAGVRVEKFCIGFGRELFGFTRGGTRYGFNVLPLGGYVKMLGQEDFVVDKSGEYKVKDIPDSFTGKSIGKRMVIVSAGVVMNLIFAAIAFTIINMVGMWRPPAIAGYVVEDSPAGRAGLLPGDKILEINGQSISNFMDMMNRIMLSDPDEVLTLKIERDGRIVSPSPELRPEYVKENERRQIGVAPAETQRVGTSYMRNPETIPEDELRDNDEIHAMIIDGKTVPVTEIGDVRRAMMQARGMPVELVVKRPENIEELAGEELVEFDPPIKSKTLHVHAKAEWLPLAYSDSDNSPASLLGLAPRLRVVAVYDGKSFAKAGVQAGDVITRIGKYDCPTYGELESALKEAGDTGAEIEVRRRGVKRDGLSDAAVNFCIDHREEIIRAGLTDVSKGREAVAVMAKAAGLSATDEAGLQKSFDRITSADGWRKWFENIDVVVLKPIIPTTPFSLVSSLPPKIDAELRYINEDQIVIADIVPKFGDRPTPAANSGLQRGAVILTVDGKPVKEWYELSHIFRDRAGETVKIEYRLVDKIATVNFDVPNCVEAALDLQNGDRIVKIDGKSSCMVQFKDPKDGTERSLPYALPDWRAAEQLLKESVGKKVEVEYVTSAGEKKTGTYDVTENGTDPWLARVQYFSRSFACYAKFEKHSISNPFLACYEGMKQAYRATVVTAQSLYHMLLTRNVGLSNVSGPLGIAQKGAEVSQGGFLALLSFLGLISANLAVINFLPLPIVDGGLFLFLILEKLRGEPVSIKMQVATQIVGILLIGTVFILVTYQDIVRMVIGT